VNRDAIGVELQGLWTDADGVVWRRVGDRPLTVRAARRAFADEAVAIVHFQGERPVTVAGAAARAELWSHIEPILMGAPSDNPNAAVQVMRFLDEGGRWLLAVEEAC
jgi:hypothetical protein